jgi:hypothetical protein
LRCSKPLLTLTHELMRRVRELEASQEDRSTNTP